MLSKNLHFNNMCKNLNKSKTVPESLVASVSVSAFLTGKAKQDFEMFIFRQKGTLPKGIESYNYYDLTKSYIVSDIVNWFDSIGFYIKTYPHLGGGQVVFYPSFKIIPSTKPSFH